MIEDLPILSVKVLDILKPLHQLCEARDDEEVLNVLDPSLRLGGSVPQPDRDYKASERALPGLAERAREF